MGRVLSTASALTIGVSTAYAGGVDRSGQSVAILFEKGNYVEFSLAGVNPDVSGNALVPALGTNSGDMSPGYGVLGAGYKHSFGNGLDAAIIFDQPYGADVSYPVATYFASGATAVLDSNAITGILKYKMPSNISVYGGLRYQSLSAEATIPFVAGYVGTTSEDKSLGYLVGAAWEKPEIALRVALTYNSSIEHDLATVENFVPGATTNTHVETPESVNLEFQTGIAPDTLLFGSVRWVHWTQFQIAPIGYLGAVGAPIVSYDSNTTTWTLGLGRKFNDTWSGAVTLGYEASSDKDGFSSNLGPTDGFWSVGVGGSYTQGPMKISAGLRYIDVGDAQTRVGALAPATNFDGNSGVAAGIKVGYTF